MKSALRFLIFASAVIATVFAYPGGLPSDTQSDEDSDKVGPIIVLSGVSDPLEDGTGAGFFGSDGETPFDGFLTGLHSMMNRLRQQIAQSLPTYSDREGFFGFSNIPEGANTTSTTKVINGHVVTVNETTYSDGDDTQGTIVRVRIVDIKPEGDEDVFGNPDDGGLVPEPEEENTTPASTTDRSVESIENIADNEIPERLVKVLPA